jgi:tetratricopeptide (TPR) repeat protein
MARGLSRLGRAYHALYQEEGRRADLEKATSLHEAAMQCPEPFHPQLAEDADTLSLTLIRCFLQNGDIIDIDRAISYLQNDLTEEVDRDKPERLSQLGMAFQLRFERLGVLSDMTSAISFLQQAVNATADGHPDKPARLSYLGISLESRFQRLGGLEDLEAAISNLRRAVELTLDDHPRRWDSSTTSGLRFDYVSSGSVASKTWRTPFQTCDTRLN